MRELWKAKELFKAFKDKGHELYVVGGWVRDALNDVESNDIDFATSALPDVTMQILST